MSVNIDDILDNVMGDEKEANPVPSKALVGS